MSVPASQTAQAAHVAAVMQTSLRAVDVVPGHGAPRLACLSSQFFGRCKGDLRWGVHYERPSPGAAGRPRRPLPGRRHTGAAIAQGSISGMLTIVPAVCGEWAHLCVRHVKDCRCRVGSSGGTDGLADVHRRVDVLAWLRAPWVLRRLSALKGPEATSRASRAGFAVR